MIHGKLVFSFQDESVHKAEIIIVSLVVFMEEHNFWFLFLCLEELRMVPLDGTNSSWSNLFSPNTVGKMMVLSVWCTTKIPDC